MEIAGRGRDGVLNPKLVLRYQRLSDVLCLLAFLIGISALIGWIFGIQSLKSVLPNLSAMKVNAAIEVVLLSVSLFLIRPERFSGPAPRRVARGMALAVVTIAALTLIEYVLGTDLGLDQFFIKEPPGALYTSHPGWQSPLMALNMVCCGLAVLLADAKLWKGLHPSHAVLFPAGGLTLLAFIGHLYGVPHLLHFVPGVSAIALNATIATLLFCAAFLLARPERGVTAILASDTAGGVLARRMLIPSVCFLCALGYFVDVFIQQGISPGNGGAGNALHSALLIMFFVYITLSTARALEKADSERRLAEKEFRESEERYYSLFESVNDAVFIFPVDEGGTAGNFIDANETACRRLGYTREELKILSMREINAAGSAAAQNPRPLLLKLLAEKEMVAESVHVAKDGGKIPVEINAKALRRNGGTIIISTARDITERKKAETERERFFRLLPDIACLAGTDGFFKKVNRPFAETLGYREEELLARPFMEFIHPEDREGTMKEVAGQLQGGATIGFENRYLCKNGSYKWLSWKAFAAPEEGLLYAVAHDITGQKRREEDISFELGELREIVQSNTDIFYVFNTEGELMKWNKALEELTGLSGKELYKRPVTEFVCREDRQNVIERMSEVFSKGSSVVEARFTGRDGSPVPHLCNGYVIKDAQGQIRGFSGTGHNITHIREAEKELRGAKETAEQALSLKDKFVSILSHDLRSPLSTVITLLKHTRMSHAESQCHECKKVLGETIKVCGSMLEMADNLLETSRIHTGVMRLNKKLCAVRDICEEAINDFEHPAADKRVTLKNEVPPNATFFVDKSLFKRVLTNLLMNAIKFTEKGGSVTLSIPPGEKNTICVEDTGVGVKEGFLSDLFKYEVHTSSPGTEGERGTGLGLPVCMDIIKAHGGTISVSTRKGKGSAFRIELPDVKPAVVVADDDEGSLIIIRNYLKGTEVELVMAGDGTQALKAIEGRPPELIISDITMPGMDGFALLRRLKANFKFAHIPVILITASPDMDVRDKAFQLGASDFITKPFSPPDFLPRVNRFIRA